jgi:hypothetical protein
MGTKDPRVDEYIENAPDFARPILKELRKRVHASVAAADETIRWGAPYFQYKDTLLGGMASFKQHCAFGFWHPLLRDGDTSLEGMGRFGKIASIGDLPPAAAFAKLAKKAQQLVDDGVKGPPRPKPPANRTVEVPKDLAAKLARNAKARVTFEGFPYSSRKEYVEWIAGAKREETRAQRIATTVEYLAEGKRLHWKYEKR